MTEFDSIKSYEPTLMTAGFVQREDLGVRVKMTSFDDYYGSYVLTEDYKKLLAAYNKLANEITIILDDKTGNQNKPQNTSKKGKHDIKPE